MFIYAQPMSERLINFGYLIVEMKTDPKVGQANSMIADNFSNQIIKVDGRLQYNSQMEDIQKVDCFKRQIIDSNIQRRREEFHFQIRKRNRQNYFTKIRKELVRNNNYCIEDLMPTMQSLSLELSIYQLLQQSYMGRLQDFLNKLRQVNSSQYLKNQQVAEFLLSIAYLLIEMAQKSEDFTEYEPFVYKVKNIIHDAIAGQDESTLQFIRIIQPIVDHPYFVELYHNILLNSLLPQQIKEQLILRLIVFLGKNPTTFINDHKTFVQYLFIAVETQPHLTSQSLNKLQICLNGLVGLVIFSKQIGPEKELQIARVYSILNKIVQEQQCAMNFLEMENLIDFVINDLECSPHYNQKAWLVLGNLFYYQEALNIIIKDRPKIVPCASNLLDIFGMEGCKNFKLAQNLCFAISNMVITQLGCKIFLQNEWIVKVYFIAARNPGTKAKMECLHIFANILEQLLSLGSQEQDSIVNVLKNGGSLLIIECLKGDKKLIQTTVKNLFQLMNSQVSFTILAEETKTIEARLDQLSDSQELIEVRNGALAILDRIRNRNGNYGQREL